MLTQTITVSPEWAASQDPAKWLTEPERAVYSGWRSFQRRAEWLAGRLAAKRLAGSMFQLAPLTFAIGREGAAPCIQHAETAAWALSLSHSHGLGAATVSERKREGSAGIDIQWVRPVRPGLCARVFTFNERRQIAERFGVEDDAKGMLLFWALKEAAIKARRAAWERPLGEIEAVLTEENAEESQAVVQMTGEPLMTAAYEWVDGWWLARVVRPPD